MGGLLISRPRAAAELASHSEENPGMDYQFLDLDLQLQQSSSSHSNQNPRVDYQFLDVELLQSYSSHSAQNPGENHYILD